MNVGDIEAACATSQGPSPSSSATASSGLLCCLAAFGGEKSQPVRLGVSRLAGHGNFVGHGYWRRGFGAAGRQHESPCSPVIRKRLLYPSPIPDDLPRG